MIIMRKEKALLIKPNARNAEYVKVCILNEDAETLKAKLTIGIRHKEKIMSDAINDFRSRFWC